MTLFPVVNFKKIWRFALRRSLLPGRSGAWTRKVVPTRIARDTPEVGAGGREFQEFQHVARADNEAPTTRYEPRMTKPTKPIDLLIHVSYFRSSFFFVHIVGPVIVACGTCGNDSMN